MQAKTTLGNIRVIAMSVRERTQLVAKILLLASLFAINEIPFWVSPKTSYEFVFLELSAIHAELCLFLAWAIFAEKGTAIGRRLWSVVGMTIAIIAVTRLLPGRYANIIPLQTALLGLASVLPGMLLILILFVAISLRSKIRLVANSSTERISRRFRLLHVFQFVAVCAFLSLLLQQFVKAPDGWFVGSARGADISQLLIVSATQSLILGLLLAPCALIILRPKRWDFLWLGYFVIICSTQPLIEQLLGRFIARQFGHRTGEWQWPESYLAVVIDNIVWYGPQMLPTVALFVLLRCTGVRVEYKK